MLRHFVIILICSLLSNVVLAQERVKIDRSTQSKSQSTKAKSSSVRSHSSGGHIQKTQPVSSTGTHSTAKNRSTFFFKVSSRNLEFEADGGEKEIKVSASQTWQITTNTSSWGHLRRTGNVLTLKVDSNTSPSSRSDFFVLKSGSRKITVTVNQAGAKFLNVSDRVLTFDSNGGTKTVSVESSGKWSVVTADDLWEHFTITSEGVSVKIDPNRSTQERTGYFIVKSDIKEFRVNIVQEAGEPYLTINNSRDDVTLQYDNYGFTKNVRVDTNDGEYEILDKPYWCHVIEKTSTGFKMDCLKNKGSYSRFGSVLIKTNQTTRKIHVQQAASPRKYRRRMNGGWINMAIGTEGGYSIGGDVSWYANAIVGLRIGNYRDVAQLEFGVCPGFVSFYDTEPEFHMPLYGSFKLSAKTGKFYLKMGGDYNLIRDKYFEGKYSLRTGFGSSWKHFEWDWAYLQFCAKNSEYGNFEFVDLFEKSNMMVGMRMAWYITR